MATPTSRFHVYRQRILAKQDFTSARIAFADMAKHAGDLEDKLIALFPQLNQGFVDNPLQKLTDTNVTPVPVQFQVQQKSGLSFIKIVLPQQQFPSTPQLFNLAVAQGPNAPLAPLFHRFQSAASDTFDSAANVQNYDPSPQLYWTLPDDNLHWRVQSSFDTINFNDFSPIVKAILLP